MTFNSIEFLIFFPLVCILYFLSVNIFHKERTQNLVCRILLLTASLFFYAYWNISYLVLILISVFITWQSGILIERFSSKRKLFLVLSLVLNLSILFVFKYANFFIDSFCFISSKIGINCKQKNFSFLLPVGISFYTFQALGYTIDVYNKKIKAEKSFLTYSVFITFFPQLVAGPIERSSNLLPQFKTFKNFEYVRVTEGLKLATWGMFKKVVIADNLAIYVNHIYDNIYSSSSLAIILATVFFSFQILCDFSGYSDIAIGIAKVLGFDLMKNFNRPYFSKSIAEFWRRWHISLSTWFKDYVYIPLGGNRCKKTRHLFNLFITFLISGLWHGASWTFVIWGALHGLYQIVGFLTKDFRRKLKIFFNIKDDAIISKMFQMLITFCLTTYAWSFFRANTVTDIFLMNSKITQIPTDCKTFFNIFYNFFTHQNYKNFITDIKILFCVIPPLGVKEICYFIFYIMIIFIVDLKTRKNSGLIIISKMKFIKRFFLYISLIVAILVLGNFSDENFIYFQF